MRIAIALSVTLIWMLPVAASAAPAPFWRNGDLVCPDGSVGKPGFMPHLKPTAQDLDDACAMRAENKRLHDVVNRPVRSPTVQERQRQREIVANLLGKPN